MSVAHKTKYASSGVCSCYCFFIWCFLRFLLKSILPQYPAFVPEIKEVDRGYAEKVKRNHTFQMLNMLLSLTTFTFVRLKNLGSVLEVLTLALRWAQAQRMLLSMTEIHNFLKLPSALKKLLVHNFQGVNDFMASNQVFDLTSSRILGFFLGMVRKSVGEKVGQAAVNGIKAEWMPNLGGVIGAGSVTTGDIFDFKSIVPKIVLWQNTSLKLCKELTTARRMVHQAKEPWKLTITRK